MKLFWNWNLKVDGGKVLPLLTKCRYSSALKVAIAGYRYCQRAAM